MDLDTFYQVLRWVLVAQFLTAAIMLWIVVNYGWQYFNRGAKRLCIGLMLLFASLAYGAGEAYVLHASGGPRIILLALAMGGVLHGLWNLRHGGGLRTTTPKTHSGPAAPRS